jgi:hypothetical protein
MIFIKLYSYSFYVAFIFYIIKKDIYFNILILKGIRLVGKPQRGNRDPPHLVRRERSVLYLRTGSAW